MYSATKIVLGTTGSNEKVVSNFSGDPATFLAGLVVRSASSGVLHLSAGAPCGVSLGIDMSDSGRTAVCRSGLLVPMIVASVASAPVLGAAVYSWADGTVDASSSGTTALNAICAKAGMTGIKADGTEVDIILADFIGGL